RDDLERPRSRRQGELFRLDPHLEAAPFGQGRPGFVPLPDGPLDRLGRQELRLGADGDRIRLRDDLDRLGRDARLAQPQLKDAQGDEAALTGQGRPPEHERGQGVGQATARRFDLGDVGQRDQLVLHRGRAVHPDPGMERRRPGRLRAAEAGERRPDDECEDEQPHTPQISHLYRLRLFAVCSISSAAWIAQYFTSYVLWLVIMATISSTTCSLDISTKPCAMLRKPSWPAGPTKGAPDEALAVERLWPML